MLHDDSFFAMVGWSYVLNYQIMLPTNYKRRECVIHHGVSC